MAPVWHGSLIAAALSAAVSLAEDAKPSAKVSGTFVVAKDAASFDGRTLILQLWKYDRRLADVAADLVEKVELKDLKHVVGSETIKEFVIGAKGVLNPDMGYYLTASVIDGKGGSTRVVLDNDKDGIGKVLTGGHPNKVVVRFPEKKP